MSCSAFSLTGHFARSFLDFLWAGPPARRTFLGSLSILVFELILSLYLVLTTHDIDDLLSLLCTERRCSLFASTLRRVRPIEGTVEVSLASAKVVLEVLDLLVVLSLVLMLLLHLVVLDGLVELFVFKSLLLLLKSLDTNLLLQKSTLDGAHVVISLEHFSQEIVGSRDGDLGLDEEFHALHDVVPGGVVEGKFALDVVVDGGELGRD